jgi:hypothetical protein
MLVSKPTTAAGAVALLRYAANVANNAMPLDYLIDPDMLADALATIDRRARS